MKFGPRTPSFSKSFSARTTGRAKRALKKSVNPYYGKKGAGLLRNPKKSMYGRVYNRTTFSIFDPLGSSTSSKKSHSNNSHNVDEALRLKFPKGSFQYAETVEIHNKKWGVLQLILSTGLGFLLYKVIGAAITGIAMLIAIIIHNKKLEYETKNIVRKLDTNQIKALVQEIDKKVDDFNKNLHIMDSCLKPDLFFDILNSLPKMGEDIKKIFIKYNVPSNDNISETIKALSNDRTEDINKFINRYFDAEYNSASKLKTKKGFLSRMDKKREELRLYTNQMNDENKELMRNLWESASFNNE